VRVAAALLGLALFGGLIVLAVAGVSAATAVLVTGAAVVVMIGLGNAVGGRHTPNQAPYVPATDDTDDAQGEDADR
jgi:drug/metabolite transporter (DMT)-like permease